MNISVVIPAFNEEKLLGATLRCVEAAGAAFREAGWGLEIIVCDNNSTDGTAALARAACRRASPMKKWSLCKSMMGTSGVMAG